jgi:protocatechuate 3,4-dioxygenase beta subunit
MEKGVSGVSVGFELKAMKSIMIRLSAAALVVITSLMLFLLLRNYSRTGRNAGTPALPGASAQAQDDPSSHHPNASAAYDKGRMDKLMELISLHDVPIKFFGMVVDQDETPLANAKVCWRIGKPGYFSVPPDIKGTTATNEYGVFLVERETGRTMNIENITKDGYRQAESTYMTYGFSGVTHPHIPDVKHPVIFLLVKDRIQKVKYVEDRGIPLAWNNGVARIPLGLDNLELLVSPTRVMEPQKKQRFDWNVEISMNDADLYEIKSGEAPLAPREGYQKMLSFVYAASDGNWLGYIDKRLAFKTSSGLFGQVHIQLYPDRENNKKSLYFSSALNKDGKRNLK